jgi:hypothetical protein
MLGDSSLISRYFQRIQAAASTPESNIAQLKNPHRHPIGDKILPAIKRHCCLDSKLIP